MAREFENVLEPDDRYRVWVYNHPIAGGFFAAFVATQIATIWGYYGVGIGLPSLPFPNYNGALFAPASVAADGSNFGNVGSFFVGQSIHFINGIVFGLWFAIVVYNKIPTFFPKMRSIQKGLLFAIVQTIISTGFLFPYVYARKLGFGVFSFGDNVLGTNHDHWKLPFAILLWHLIWGAILGYLYDPRRPDEVRVVEVRT
jgi:hypothetical protein